MCPKCGGQLNAEGKCTNPNCETNKVAGQGTGQQGAEKKILGRYKDEDEAIKALQSLETRLTEFGEDNKFLQEELERRDRELQGLRVGGPQPGAQPATSQDPFVPTEDEQRLLKTDPVKGLASYGRRIHSHAINDAKGMLTQVKDTENYGNAVKSAFYTANKDLVGKELLVGAVSGQVMAENPKVPPHLLLGRIAERTRQELERLVGKTATPGTRSEGGETRGNQSPQKTPSQTHLEQSINFEKTGKLS